MKKTNKKTNTTNKINRIKLYAAGITLGTGLGLAGCQEVESQPVASEVVSEIESEEVSEVVSEVVEVPTEEISEEVSEEVVETADYSADGIIKFSQNLIAKYPEQDSNEIVAGVISVNLDYITDEDLDKILNTYGCSEDDMSNYFKKYMDDYTAAVDMSNACTTGVFTWDYDVNLRNKKFAGVEELFIEDSDVKKTVENVILSYANNDYGELYYFAPEDAEKKSEMLTYDDEKMTENGKSLINYVISDRYNTLGEYYDRISDKTLPLERKKLYQK